MADQVVDSFAPSGTSQSPWSILNKLPTKRLDAAITRAAEQGIPDQGAQTGGYAPTYLHLSHIPLFPLYSAAQHDLLAKQQARKADRVNRMDAVDPDKKLTGGQKAFLGVLGLVSGGGGIVSAKRWERRLEGASVWSSNNLMQQNKLVVFTRWTVPSVPGGGQHQRGTPAPWFVDVLEHRFLQSGPEASSLKRMGGNVVMLKVGIRESVANEVTLRLLKTEAKGLKTQKMWTKRMNYEPCEGVVFVGESEIVALEVAARIRRACSTVEAMEIQKRFNKEWLVPVVQ